MDPSAIASVDLGNSVGGEGLLGLFWQADIIVKLVMLMLLAASVWCWAVIADKVTKLVRLKTRARQFESAFWSGRPLDELYQRVANRADHPMALVFATAMDEWRDSPPPVTPAAQKELQNRVGSVMELTMTREMQALETNLPSLATIGSTAPFIGLFGTVWGIMNSFQAIAATKNTTLAVVAPGIAEALFATALGLLAAIPAVVAYNQLSGSLDAYADRLGNFIDEFRVVLSREMAASRVA